MGQTPEVRVWRIEKFQVKHWPKEQYGEFFKGDSYIGKGKNDFHLLRFTSKIDLYIHLHRRFLPPFNFFIYSHEHLQGGRQ